MVIYKQVIEVFEFIIVYKSAPTGMDVIANNLYVTLFCN